MYMYLCIYVRAYLFMYIRMYVSKYVGVLDDALNVFLLTVISTSEILF